MVIATDCWSVRVLAVSFCAAPAACIASAVATAAQSCFFMRYPCCWFRPLVKRRPATKGLTAKDQPEGDEDQRRPGQHGKSHALAEEQPAPQDAEHRNQEADREGARRADVADQREEGKVGDAAAERAG